MWKGFKPLPAKVSKSRRGSGSLTPTLKFALPLIRVRIKGSSNMWTGSETPSSVGARPAWEPVQRGKGFKPLPAKEPMIFLRIRHPWPKAEDLVSLAGSGV